MKSSPVAQFRKAKVNGWHRNQILAGNPTLVVLTDRNDLDDQLFGQFQRCADILGQTPVQASGREHLRELLNRASGGVVFTTIHKFMPEKGEAMPELSARQNIVVIADEAHRSQYGFGGKVNEKTGEMSYGFASNLRDALPNASFIGFTGTPSRRRTRTRGRSSAITFDAPLRSHPSGTSLRSCPSRSARFHLRHPARCRRQGHGADLLREPHLTPSRPRSVGLRPTRCVVHLSRPTWLHRFQAQPERRRAAEDRRGV
jgi:hypothetical protein